MSEMLETAELRLLADLPIGTRLLVKCKKDWRSAVISKIVGDIAVLLIASPTGYSYRIRRHVETQINIRQELLILGDGDFDWSANFVNYDRRW